MPQVDADALEDASVAAVLAQEDDGSGARGGDDDRRHEERERLPDVEEHAAADQRRPERHPAEEMLHALRAAEGLSGRRSG